MSAMLYFLKLFKIHSDLFIKLTKKIEFKKRTDGRNYHTDVHKCGKDFKKFKGLRETTYCSLVDFSINGGTERAEMV